MKFIVDKEAKQALTQLCDMALKQGGLQNLQAIQAVLTSVEDMKDESEV